MIVIGQAAQILRFDRRQANVVKLRTDLGCKRLDKLRFAHTGLAMQHPRCGQRTAALRLPCCLQHFQCVACGHGLRVHAHAGASCGAGPSSKAANRA